MKSGGSIKAVRWTIASLRKSGTVFFVPQWGWMVVVGGDRGIAGLLLPTGKREAMRFVQIQGAELIEGDPILEEAKGQILQYFSKGKRFFTFPLDWTRLSDFSRKVLGACSEIPFGEVRSYGWLAERANLPGAARAVGRVLASNPFPLVIPCHRVVRADGSLCGFSRPGGVKLKRKLLKFEREVARRWPQGERKDDSEERESDDCQRKEANRIHHSDRHVWSGKDSGPQMP